MAMLAQRTSDTGSPTPPALAPSGTDASPDAPSTTGWAREEGTPFPLGVTWLECEQAYNFALYSKHANSVTLLLYREDDVFNPVVTYDLPYLRNKSGRVWHCRIALEAMNDAMYYGYTVSGPAFGSPIEWHFFEPEKILLDPYAKAVFFPPAFDRQAAMEAGANAGRAPLGLIHPHHCPRDWHEDLRPRHDSDLIIYELHVRGFTCHESSGMTESAKGTFAGLVEKIPYLRQLGITAVELMPVFQFDPQEGNYWGYMPLNFFAPHAQYARGRDACQQHCEFREMVKALHDADIEVILDVVYNHTAEGDHRGPAYSFRGIDNSTYYLMTNGSQSPYANFSGAGNTLHTSNRCVRRLILDSLCYWAREMHVDGFRFDLASVFSRKADGSLSLDDPPIFGDIRAHPELEGLRLIAEPWDASGAYELGRGFPGSRWHQWNGQFRDDLRRFVRGDPGMVPALMTRLYGSDDLFPDDLIHAFRPCQSINYAAAHDGFTLYDLVSYEHRRNWANGHDNRDGPNDEYSWNCGSEGDEDLPPEVLQLRKRQAKNLCCLLLLSNGTPMFRAGDEFLQTQGGNSNPYNQDNPTSWLDWRRLEQHSDIFRFFRCMIAFRKAHPSLSRSRFWRNDVKWYGPEAGVDMTPNSRCLAFCLNGRTSHDTDIYVLINTDDRDIDFKIQDANSLAWHRVVDTSLGSPADVSDPGEETLLSSPHYCVTNRSVVVFIRGIEPLTLVPRDAVASLVSDEEAKL